MSEIWSSRNGPSCSFSLVQEYCERNAIYEQEAPWTIKAYFRSLTIAHKYLSRSVLNCNSTHRVSISTISPSRNHEFGRKRHQGTMLHTKQLPVWRSDCYCIGFWYNIQRHCICIRHQGQAWDCYDLRLARYLPSLVTSWSFSILFFTPFHHHHHLSSLLLDHEQWFA